MKKLKLLTHRTYRLQTLVFWKEIPLSRRKKLKSLDKLRASEPCKSSCGPCETQVSSHSISFSSVIGYLAWVFVVLALLSLSFCYLLSSFSSFVKVSFVLFCCHSILRFDVLFLSGKRFKIHAYHLHAITDSWQIDVYKASWRPINGD